MSQLPTPRTSTDIYAHASVIELRALNSNIERLVNILDEITKVEDVAAQGDEVELKEPEKPKRVTRDDKQAAEKAAEKPAKKG